MTKHTPKTMQVHKLLSNLIFDWYLSHNEDVRKYIEEDLLTLFNVVIVEEAKLTPAGFIKVTCLNIETRKEVKSELFYIKRIK